MHEQLSNFPYVQAHTQGKRQNPRIVELRLSHSSSAPASSLAIADNWYRSKDLEPSHYVVDEAFIYQCVPDNRQTTLDGSSKGHVSVTLCSQIVARGGVWNEKVLDRAARITSELCFFHNIQVQYLAGPPAKGWKHILLGSDQGILVSIEGYFPIQDFYNKVRDNVAELKRSAK